MYPTYSDIQIYSRTLFQEYIIEYTKIHSENISQVLGDSLPLDIHHMISSYSIPSWCDFNWEAYRLRPSAHMIWCRADIENNMVNVHGFCQQLLKYASTLQNLHQCIVYHDPKRDITLSFSALISDHIPYAIV